MKKKSGKKDLTRVVAAKPVKKIIEYYYFLQEDLHVRQLRTAVGEAFEEQTDIWPELNLMEIVMQHDSLIFQDAAECFVDPADLAWFEEHGIKKQYQISYDIGDIAAVRKVMKNIMDAFGGVICSDTDDFEPSFRADTLDQLAES